MKCPICKKTVKPGNPEAPFCSERCRTIDLGNWAAGNYVISTIPLNQPGRDVPENDPDED